MPFKGFEGFLKYLLPIITGIFLYLAFSKYSLWFFIFPAVFMLLRFKSLKFWFITGFTFFFLSLLWIRIAMIKYGEVFPPVAYILIVLLVLFLTLYQFVLTFLIWKKLKFSYLLLPFVWTFIEILRSNFPYGGFPWLLFGEMLLYIPFFKDYLSAGGVFLGSILIWFSVVLLFLRNLRHILSVILIFILPLPFIKEVPEFENLKGLKIAVVQPNVREDIKLDKDRFYEYLPVYWEILKEVERENPDIVFLPESAFPFTANELPEEGKELLEFSEKFTVITGIIDIRVSEDIEPYNSVFVIKDGEVVDFYDKVRLLPFGEYVPFPFGFTKEIFGSIAGIDYVRGEGPRCVKAENLSIATPICFEVSCFSYVKRMSSCADIIAVLTNDGWFEDSDGTFQHLRHARLRAVENRKYVIWVNNTGPSAVINPEGEIVKEIPYGRAGYFIFSFEGD